jgi:hypothetical protein
MVKPSLSGKTRMVHRSEPYSRRTNSRTRSSRGCRHIPPAVNESPGRNRDRPIDLGCSQLKIFTPASYQGAKTEPMVYDRRSEAIGSTVKTDKVGGCGGDRIKSQCQVALCCSNNLQSSIRTVCLAFAIDTVCLRGYVSYALPSAYCSGAGKKP